MKKPTLATLKSFINKNRPALHINCVSSFDGMQDCVAYKENSKFKPATKSDGYKNTLGINGVWVVGRDSIRPYDKDGFNGFEVYNCCGTFIVAVKA
jgi:hypothetical protein